MVLPVPFGPTKTTLVPSSMKSTVNSSSMSARSIYFGCFQSKSARDSKEPSFAFFMR